MNSGLKDIVKVSKHTIINLISYLFIKFIYQNYKPAWFYFTSFTGQVAGQVVRGPHDKTLSYERVVLEDEIEGDMLLDVLERKGFSK
jgi:hypothetical protein